MKLRRVDPHKIRIPEVRVTARMSEETAEQFKSSVKEVGIDEPIKVFDVEGELWLSDGLHRLQEAKANNLELVDVTVRAGTMVDVLANNLMSGHLRGKHPISEMRRVISELYNTHKVDIEEIVKRTGFTREYTENLLLVSELTPLVLAALDDERVGLTAALLLAKFKDPEEQEKHYWMLVNYHMSLDTFRGYLKDYAALQVPPAPTPTPTAPREPTKIACAYCGDLHLPEELASVITCKACAGILYQATAQAKREFEADQKAAHVLTPAEGSNPNATGTTAQG